MKNKLLLTCEILCVSITLLACSNSCIASIENKQDFTQIGENKDFNTYVHHGIGCYFIISNSHYNRGNATQIIGADGLPYCKQYK